MWVRRLSIKDASAEPMTGIVVDDGRRSGRVVKTLSCDCCV